MYQTRNVNRPDAKVTKQRPPCRQAYLAGTVTNGLPRLADEAPIASVTTTLINADDG